MGILLIVIGLAAAGLVVDFVIENDLVSGAAEQSYDLLGTSITLSQAEVVIASAVLGAVALLLFVTGLRLLGGTLGKRRERRRRIKDLERENEELRARQEREAEEATEEHHTVVVPEAPPDRRRQEVPADRD